MRLQVNLHFAVISNIFVVRGRVFHPTLNDLRLDLFENFTVVNLLVPVGTVLKRHIDTWAVFRPSVRGFASEGTDWKLTSDFLSEIILPYRPNMT
jgi:hypothetical protein